MFDAPIEPLSDAYSAEIDQMKIYSYLLYSLDTDVRICDFIQNILKPNHYMFLLESDEKGYWYGWDGIISTFE